MGMSMPSVQIITHLKSRNECRYHAFDVMNVCGVARVFIQYLLEDQREDNKRKQMDEVLRY